MTRHKRTTTFSATIHPGDAPTVTFDSGDDAAWIDIGDEMGTEHVTIFLNPAMITALSAALDKAKAVAKAAA